MTSNPHQLMVVRPTVSITYDGHGVIVTLDPTAGEWRKVGEKPKPRVLLSWGGPARPQVAQALALCAPTVREVTSFKDVRMDQYDVLVTDRLHDIADGNADEHLFVISFVGGAADRNWGRTDVVRYPSETDIKWQTGFVSEELEVPVDLLTAVVDLVNDDLLPVARARPQHMHTTITAARPTGRLPNLAVLSAATSAGATSRPTDPLAELHPFLRTAPPLPQDLAASYRRTETSEGWIVPHDVTRPWDWVTAAIRHWAIVYDRFPLVGGWWEDARWQTRSESEAARRRAALKADLASVTARLHVEIAAATTALEDASRSAIVGLRRLLTEKGDPLKEAVANALAQLGYKVTDRDLEPRPDAGGKIQDLGVTDPDNPVLDPIVEVKGYDSGAKANDFGAMVRHQVRAERAGRSPSAIWWVANHWRSRAPDDRPMVLAGEEPMIAEHAGEDVPLVLIDTRNLFRAVRAVEDGLTTAAEVRASLRAARGRWTRVSE